MLSILTALALEFVLPFPFEFWSDGAALSLSLHSSFV